MKAETAVKRELKAIGSDVSLSTLGVVAVQLACRLDADPSERDRVLLARELRLCLRELRGLAGDDVVSETERFLERISNPAFRGPGD